MSIKRIFTICTLCLCWRIISAVPLGPFNTTLLEKLKSDYQKGDKEVILYIKLQEKMAEKYGSSDISRDSLLKKKNR